MKLIAAFTILLFVASSSASVIKVYRSIDEFKALYPDAELIEMDMMEHELDDSRSYSIGRRQTGKESNQLQSIRNRQ